MILCRRVGFPDLGYNSLENQSLQRLAPSGLAWIVWLRTGLQFEQKAGCHHGSLVMCGFMFFFPAGELKEKGREAECRVGRAVSSSQRARKWVQHVNLGSVYTAKTVPKPSSGVHTVSFFFYFSYVIVFFFCSFSTFLFSLVNLAHCRPYMYICKGSCWPRWWEV